MIKSFLVIWSKKGNVLHVRILIFLLISSWRWNMRIWFASDLLREFRMTLIWWSFWISKTWFLFWCLVSKGRVWSKIQWFFITSSDWGIFEVVKSWGVYQFWLWCFSIDIFNWSIVTFGRTLLVRRRVFFWWVWVAVMLRLVMLWLLFSNLV